MSEVGMSFFATQVTKALQEVDINARFKSTSNTLTQSALEQEREWFEGCGISNLRISRMRW